MKKHPKKKKKDSSSCSLEAFERNLVVKSIAVYQVSKGQRPIDQVKSFVSYKLYQNLLSCFKIKHTLPVLVIKTVNIQKIKKDVYELKISFVTSHNPQKITLRFEKQKDDFVVVWLKVVKQEIFK